MWDKLGWLNWFYQFLFEGLTSFNLKAILSDIDDVLSINPSANEFVFWDLNVHHKDWLTYSGGTDRPGELCSNIKQPYSDG